MPSRTAVRCAAIAQALRKLMLAASFAWPAALVLGLIEAKADEAYVCEGGRIVTVRLGELDVMKRKDPCIAAYFGVKPEPVVEASTEPPLPERKPEIALAAVAHPAATPPHATASLTALTDIVTAPRVEKVVFKHAGVRPSLDATPADGAKVPVDFRRVPILNAQPGAPAIFYHTR